MFCTVRHFVTCRVVRAQNLLLRRAEVNRPQVVVQTHSENGRFVCAPAYVEYGRSAIDSRMEGEEFANVIMQSAFVAGDALIPRAD